MISIKRHECHSAQSSYQPHDLTYQSFYKTHVSHGNKALSSITETNSRGLDAFNSHTHTQVRKIDLHLYKEICTWLSDIRSLRGFIHDGHVILTIVAHPRVRQLRNEK
jgi:hypothetical protein